MNTTAKAADPARASIRSMNDASERVDVANALNVIRPTLGDTAGVALYRRLGFREVGIYREHGQLDGRWVDVLLMERLL